MGPQHPNHMGASGHIADRLNAWLSGSLPEAEAAELRSHLAGCAACEEERRLLEASRDVVQPGPAVEARPWFATKVAARAAELRPRPVGAPWWRLAFGGGLAAGALAALALVAVPALQKHEPAPRRIELETSGSRSACSSTSKISLRKRLFSALRFSGRFNVMRRTRGRGSSTMMCW